MSTRAAFAPGTHKNLRTQWRAYFLFCIYFHRSPLPASAHTLCLYAQFLSRSFKAVASIRNYISGVKLLHLLMDHDCPAFGAMELKLALRGLARLNPHMPTQASPITPHLLLRIYNVLDMTQVTDTVMWSLYLTAFFSFLRKSNLVPLSPAQFDPSCQLARGRVAVGSSSLLLCVKWTKTLQFGNRVLQIPLLAIPDSPLCPVRAYKNMIKLVPGPPMAPAFALPVGSGLQAVSYNQLTRHLRQVLDRIGIGGASFSSHSFRRGGATWAFKSGVAPHLIQLQGDWVSEAYQKYIDISLEQKVSVASSMRHHLAPNHFLL